MQVYLVDPPGSGMYNKVTRGVMFAKEEAEQKRLKNPTDTITEGVGINRLTANFERYAFSAQIWPHVLLQKPDACIRGQLIFQTCGQDLGLACACSSFVQQLPSASSSQQDDKHDCISQLR